MYDRIRNHLSIQFTLIIIIIEIVILSIIGYQYYINFASEVDVALIDRLRLISDLFETGDLKPITLINPDSMYELVGDDIIDAILIEGEEVVFTLNPDYRRQSVDEITFLRDISVNFDVEVFTVYQAPGPEDRWILSYLNVVDDFADKKFGLILRASTVAAETRKQEVAQLLLFGFTITAVVSSVAIYIALDRLVLTRIKDLVDVVNLVGQGNLRVRPRFLQKNDELGVLSNGVKQMITDLENLINNLEVRVAERTHDLKTSTDLSHQLVTILDSSRLLDQIVSGTSKQFDLHQVGIFQLDSNKQTLTLVASAGYAGRQLIKQNHQFHISDHGLVPTAARTQKQAVSNDVRDGSSAHVVSPLLHDTLSEASFPIMFGDELLGVLDLQSKQVDRFSDNYVELFASFANQIAIAIHNARLFEDVEAARQKAELADKAKSAFLANMSHELRTPLNAILGYAQILQRRLSQPEAIRSLITIQQSGTHLLTLINDILDTARVEAGKMKLLPTAIHFPTFLDTIVEIIRSRAGEKELDFTCETIGSLPEGIHVDELRLRQVLLNLLSNAVKFTDTGQVTLRVNRLDRPASTIQQLASQCQLRFEVVDTGIGIEPDQLEKIFQPFEQLGAISRHAEGTGLGLAISRQLVQLMGSDIYVKSTPGQGSHFWFDLTLPKAEISAKPEVSSTRKYAGYRDSRRTILVVDDVASNRAVMIDLLVPLGFEVIEAADGRQAIDLVQETKPDMILMDRRMPVMDGFASTQQIRQLPDMADMPIISVSASVSDQSLETGYDAFLPKPIDFPQLATLLEKFLKLDWIYADDQDGGLTIDETLSDVTAPPQDELEHLRELALQGNMPAIRERASYLETLDKRYVAFARSLQDLARQFERQQILTLLRRYLEEEP